MEAIAEWIPFSALDTRLRVCRFAQFGGRERKQGFANLAIGAAGGLLLSDEIIEPDFLTALAGREVNQSDDRTARFEERLEARKRGVHLTLCHCVAVECDENWALV